MRMIWIYEKPPAVAESEAARWENGDVVLFVGRDVATVFGFVGEGLELTHFSVNSELTEVDVSVMVLADGEVRLG